MTAPLRLRRRRTLNFAYHISGPPVLFSPSSALPLSTPYNMDEYSCRNVPSELYRVHYPGSRTAFSTEQGFEAADTTTTFGPGELNKFKRAIEKHFTWGYRNPQPFISLFSDRSHAMNWGCKEPWCGRGISKGGWALHTVSTTHLESKSFFKLSDLVEKLRLDLPEGAKQHIHGAFICLHRIPATAIVDERSGQEVESEVESEDELGKHLALNTGR